MYGLDPELQRAIEDARAQIAARAQTNGNGNGYHYSTNGTGNGNGYVKPVEELIAPGRARILEMNAQTAQALARTGEIRLGCEPCFHGTCTDHVKEAVEDYW